MLKKLINKFCKNSKSIFSFRQSVELAGLPCITFYQGNAKFNFLLDSGSTDSIIDSNVLNRVKHNMVADNNILSGLEGIEKKVDICHIELEYQNNTYDADFLISNMQGIFSSIKKQSGVTLHGILGVQFFNKYKYVLDFDEMIAYNKK